MTSWRHPIRVGLVRGGRSRKEHFSDRSAALRSLPFDRALPVGRCSTGSVGWMSAPAKRQVRFRVGSKGRLPTLRVVVRRHAASGIDVVFGLPPDPRRIWCDRPLCVSQPTLCASASAQTINDAAAFCRQAWMPASTAARYSTTSSARPASTSCAAVEPENPGMGSSRNQRVAKSGVGNLGRTTAMTLSVSSEIGI